MSARLSLEIQNAIRKNFVEDRRLVRSTNGFHKEFEFDQKEYNRKIWALNRSVDQLQVTSGQSRLGLHPKAILQSTKREKLTACFLYGDRLGSRRFGKNRSGGEGVKSIYEERRLSLAALAKSRIQTPVSTPRPESCPPPTVSWEQVLERARRTPFSAVPKDDNYKGTVMVNEFSKASYRNDQPLVGPDIRTRRSARHKATRTSNKSAKRFKKLEREEALQQMVSPRTLVGEETNVRDSENSESKTDEKAVRSMKSSVLSVRYKEQDLGEIVRQTRHIMHTVSRWRRGAVTLSHAPLIPVQMPSQNNRRGLVSYRIDPDRAVYQRVNQKVKVFKDIS